MQNHALLSHLHQARLSFAEFGRLCGCTPSTMHRYANGHRIPSAAMKKRIEHESGGAVPAESWIKMILHREMPRKTAV